MIGPINYRKKKENDNFRWIGSTVDIDWVSKNVGNKRKWKSKIMFII